MSDNNRPDTGSGEPLDVVRAPRLGRRAVVKGAAWSLPVIATATALPAAAASTVANTDLGVSFTGASFDLRSSLNTAITALIGADPLGLIHNAVNTVMGLLGNLSFDYPSDLIVTNIGTAPLDSGESFDVVLDYGSSDVLNLSALDQLGNVNAVNIPNGSVDLTITSTASIPPRGQVADIPLSYNPITVQIDLASLQDQLPPAMSGVLTGDLSPNQNTASSAYGLDVTLLPGFAAAVGTLSGMLSLPVFTLNVLA